jgi:hypothetical protein
MEAKGRAGGELRYRISLAFPAAMEAKWRAGGELRYYNRLDFLQR